MKTKLYSFAMIGLLGLNLNMPKREFKTEVKEKFETKIENRVEKFKNNIANLQNVKVTAKDSVSITVDNNGVSVKVLIDDKTKFRRKFWGKSDLNEISVNDMVNVWGRYSDDTKTVINGGMIRNLSIQKRFGVFFGEVKSISGDSFVMSTIHRDDEVVTVGTAKLLNRKQETINKTDILVGHRVRVRGLWDNTNKTITEVKEIKDFSLPVKPTGSPTPTP